MVFYCVIWCYTVLYFVILCYVILCFIVLYCVIWCYLALTHARIEYLTGTTGGLSDN